MSTVIETGITKLLGIKYPIMLAGMNKVSGPRLAAAVSNAGGIGVFGGATYSPRILKLQLQELKSYLNDDSLPWGVDLMIPKIGGTARKTNKDYTNGNLNKLIDIIIDEKAKLFVCAVGVPPKFVVDKLHKNGIPIMNMVGHPKHVKYAINAGVDIICAQGGEAGGHTNTIPTSLLLPKCVDLVKGYKSTLYPDLPIYVVGAGGIYDGRGLCMALSYGCEAIWVGTRFVCSIESGASISHKNAIINASYDDTRKTLIYTGRPARFIKNDVIEEWGKKENNDKLMKLLNEGIIPVNYFMLKDKPFISGQVCGAINDILSAKQIIDNIMNEAIQMIKSNSCRLKLIQKSKL